MKKQIRGSVCLLSATVIWGFAFIAQSAGMNKIGPFTFQAIRCILAVVFLFICTLIQDFIAKDLRRGLTKWRDPRLWKAGSICGAALFIAASFQQVALVYTDAGKAGFITAMYIVLVPILGLFLGHIPPKSAFLSVPLAVIGLYLLSCTNTSGINKGDLYLMGCALAFAVQINYIDFFSDNLDSLRMNCIQCLVVSVLSIPFALFSESIELTAIVSCWFPLVFAGVLSMGVAYTLQIVGQRALAPAPAALIMSLESVFAALGGWLFLDESMTTVEKIGSALVLSAVILSQLPPRRQR